jgi:hypothetical protein
MYYVDDVMCAGPSGGLALGVEVHPAGWICFTISGYSGQDGRTFYLSSQPGHPSYHGSLAVKKSQDDSCHFIVKNMSVIYIYTCNLKINVLLNSTHSTARQGEVQGIVAIRNHHNLYMKIEDDVGLVFESPVLDEDARFIVQPKGKNFALIG